VERDSLHAGALSSYRPGWSQAGLGNCATIWRPTMPPTRPPPSTTSVPWSPPTADWLAWRASAAPWPSS